MMLMLMLMLMLMFSSGTFTHRGEGTKLIASGQLQAEPHLVTRGRHRTETQQHEMGTPRRKLRALTRLDLDLRKLLHTLVTVYLPGGVHFHPFSNRRTGRNDTDRHIAGIGDDKVGGSVGLSGRQGPDPGIAEHKRSRPCERCRHRHQTPQG